MTIDSYIQDRARAVAAEKVRAISDQVDSLIGFMNPDFLDSTFKNLEQQYWIEVLKIVELREVKKINRAIMDLVSTEPEV